MRAAERLDLLEKIGVELQKRYTFQDIDGFLSAHGMAPDGVEHGTSKRLYAKEVLRDVSEPNLLSIATELGLIHGLDTTEPPANWRGTTQVKLFISHVTDRKDIATRLKYALAFHAIAGFVAHEDIEPTLPWQDEIERALNTMDALVAVHTPGFSKSVWTQQEIGFALGRGTKIISFEMGELPTGFLAKHQALKRQKRNAEQIAQEIARTLLRDPRTSDKLKSAQDALRDVLP